MTLEFLEELQGRERTSLPFWNHSLQQLHIAFLYIFFLVPLHILLVWVSGNLTCPKQHPRSETYDQDNVRKDRLFGLLLLVLHGTK